MRFLRDAKKRSFSPPLTPICRYVTEDKHERFRRMRRSSNLTRYEDERKEFSSLLVFTLPSKLCNDAHFHRLYASRSQKESGRVFVENGRREEWKSRIVFVFDSPFWGMTLFDGTFCKSLAVGQFSRYEKLTPDLRGVTRAGFTYLLANSFDRRDCFHPPFRSIPEIWRGIHLGWKITIDWTVRGTNPVNFNR